MTLAPSSDTPRVKSAYIGTNIDGNGPEEPSITSNTQNFGNNNVASPITSSYSLLWVANRNRQGSNSTPPNDTPHIIIACN